MTIPNKEECYALLKEYKLPANVIRHVETVTKIAMFLAQKLKEKGEDINLELVQAGGLLHDIVRHKDFKIEPSLNNEEELKEFKKIQKQLLEKYSDMEHCEAGYLEIKDKYPEVALVVRKHFGKSMLSEDPGIKPQNWEEKLILYGDCRVQHDKIVGAMERRKDIYARFPEYYEKIKKNVDAIHKAILDLEKQIFNKIGLDPDKLGEYIE